MAIFLHIKGDKETAAKALDDRGFNPADRLTEIKTYTPRGMPEDYVVSDIQVKDVCGPGVMRWFNENDRPPFPSGSLLHFSAA